MANAFRISRVGAHSLLPLPETRRTQFGHYGTCVSLEHPVETVTVPTSLEALFYALTIDGAFHKETARVIPENKVAWLRESNEASYLTGVLGMAGSLTRARDLLLHPFLREQFAKLGGISGGNIHNETPVLNALEKLSQKRLSYDLQRQADRIALAKLVVNEAQRLKSSTRYITYSALREDWRRYRKAVVDRDSPLAPPNQASSQLEEDSLDTPLSIMRRRKMLFQGHRWTCQNCNHQNWIDFTELSPTLICNVCKFRTDCPVNIMWAFRPNHFLIQSLRNHSVLSLIWLMSALCSRAIHSVLLGQPTFIGFTANDGKPDAEADLLAVIDGEAYLCEVKASWRGVRNSDITRFTALALRLRPDVALFAVMEDGDGDSAVLNHAHATLEASDIRFEILVPKNTELLDSSSFYIEDDGVS